MFSPLLMLVADAYPLISPTASAAVRPLIRHWVVPGCWFSTTIGLLGSGLMAGDVSTPTASADRAAGMPPFKTGRTTLETDERTFETDDRAFASGGTFGNERTFGNASDG